MAKLWQVAKLIRSKNAGPFELTFDVIFKDREIYEKVRDARIINAQWFARTYRLTPEVVSVIEYDAAAAIKVTIPRPVISGDVDDTDVFGGQQYGPLVDLEVPWAMARTLKILSSNSIRAAMGELVPQFERASGITISISYDPAKVMLARIAKGETADLAITGSGATPRSSVTERSLNAPSRSKAASSAARPIHSTPNRRSSGISAPGPSA